MMRKISMVAAAVTAFVATTEARADPADHTGFMARLGLGAGFLSSSETVGTGSLSVSGFAGSGQLALGVYVVPNLAIHATVWGGTAFNPSVSYSGSFGTISGSTSDASLLSSAVGAGATYFLTPVDVYFSASVGAGFLSYSTTRGSTTTTSSTDAGIALNVAAGKQWALGREWGIGVSGQFGWQSNPDNAGGGSSSASVSTVQAGLLFSLTYH